MFVGLWDLKHSLAPETANERGVTASFLVPLVDIRGTAVFGHFGFGLISSPRAGTIVSRSSANSQEPTRFQK